ncbi:MAG: dTDP-glucose 4,6-dehydratase [Syntrophaceae bacterium CG2_30_49_12]|nr:MAG: dTDP-glucose 4,6-dehydratase [Syntrophaceae bacterium CG2_30_49_12]PIP06743.1 MAG: dTDP-glucose 4,6-dehydratase [Syntrophobacterales bacterium CG23_combo_of_CG06-09_8_20_14_all_48_27]PJC74007.1 MAG: dTDP-glucose 4,6-dehydratase [Syntrophobacterales bacterium CG_4_8_14_3_um_filter_49_14]
MEIKNLILTGGCGFIGSNFIRYLLEAPDFTGRIINVDKLTYAGNIENLSGIGERYPDRYIFQRADICDLDLMRDIFLRYNVDAICHFAAESHVDRSIKHPKGFIHTNVIGTFNLLEIARTNAENFVLFHHISTDEVYGSLGLEGYFTEASPYRPNSPYSASKAASDHLVRAYHKTYGLPTTISNCSNNYGPYQFPEKLIPLIIINAMQGKPLPVYGDGKNVRDWLYVRDHCEAVWTVMQAGRRGETYNIGGNSEMENIVIVEMICDLLDEIIPPSTGRSRREMITFVKDRPGHDRRYAIDFSKLREELHWDPRESFASGLRKTILWYLDNGPWIDRVQSGAYQTWIAEQYGEPES